MLDKKYHPAMLKALAATAAGKAWWNHLCNIPASYAPGFSVKTLEKAIAEGLIQRGSREHHGMDTLLDITKNGMNVLKSAGMWQLPQEMRDVLTAAQAGGVYYDGELYMVGADLGYIDLLCDEGLGFLTTRNFPAPREGWEYILTEQGKQALLEF